MESHKRFIFNNQNRAPPKLGVGQKLRTTRNRGHRLPTDWPGSMFQ
jgi:hypothetical protein